MARPIIRQSLDIDEAFDIRPPHPEQVKLERTPNLGDMLDPNWDKPGEQFELGIYNVLHPRISEKPPEMGLGILIEMMGKQNELVLMIIKQMLDFLTKKVK